MSKRVQQKIKLKHPDMFIFTDQSNFIRLMDATIGYCLFDVDTINFIAHIQEDDRYILYSLKKEKYHTICSTIFALRADTLKHYYRHDDFKLLKSDYGKVIEEYLKT